MGTEIQRTIVLVFFGMSLLLLWDRWQVHNGRPSTFGTAPSPQQQPVSASPVPAVPSARPSTDASLPPATPTGAAPAVPPAQTADATAAIKSTPVVIETDVMRASIDPLGAVVSRVELLDQRAAPDWTASGFIGLVTGKKHDPSQTSVLLDVGPNRVYVAQSGLVGGDFPNHRTPFKWVEGPTRLEPGQDRLDVVFRSESGGLRVNKTYSFFRGRHAAEVTHEVVNLSDKPLSPFLYLQLTRDGNKPDGESPLYVVYTGPAVFTEQEKFRKVDFSDIEKNKADAEKMKAILPRPTDNGWVGMIQHYFVSSWVPPEGIKREIYALSGEKNLYSIGSKSELPAIAPGATASTRSTLYAGPQDQDALAKIAPGLDLVVDYGWLTFLAKPIYWLLAFLHGIVGNWGWAIVLLTVLIKAAFYPLSAASYKSMAKMKEVTPRMMKIREQYSEDKQKMNVAMMELYKTEKINPLGGCLPILVQIPVFIALYWALLGAVEMRDAPWILWITDLSAPDSLFGVIPVINMPIGPLPIIMMITMVIQTKLNPTPPDPIQAKITMYMPFIFGGMFFFFPSGLVLYWVVNNALSIAQQWQITRMVERGGKAANDAKG